LPQPIAIHDLTQSRRSACEAKSRCPTHGGEFGMAIAEALFVESTKVSTAAIRGIECRAIDD
jgi:hypothetical protein